MEVPRQSRAELVPTGTVPHTSVASILSGKGYRVISIEADASVYSAVATMAKEKVGALPVLEGGGLVGIVSERDYARKVVLADRSSKTTAVSEIMSAEVIVVSPRDTLAACLELMARHRIRHLPVVSLGRLAGMLSVGDLVWEVIRQQQHTVDELCRYVSG